MTCPDCGYWPELQNETHPVLRHLTHLIERIHHMSADLTTAVSDLTAIVTQTVTAEQGLEAQVASLQAKLAANPSQDPSVANVAATIEAQVASLKAALPAAPAETAPADTTPSEPAPAEPAPSEPAPADVTAPVDTPPAEPTPTA